MLDRPAQARHDAAGRAFAVRVLGEHRLGLADPPGARLERPVERIADDRDRGAGLWVLQPQRRRVEAVDAQHRDVVVRVERDRLGPQRAAARRHDLGVLLARDDVRRRDDEPVGRDPAAALDAEPAGGAEHAHDARRRRAHARACASTRGSGGSVGTGGPAKLGNGSIRASAFSSERGGTISFSCCSTYERCTARRRSAWPGSCSAIAPSTQTIAKPISAPATTPPAESSARTPRARSRLRISEPIRAADHLEGDREGDRRDERDHRRVVRAATRSRAAPARASRRGTRPRAARPARARSRRSPAPPRRAPPAAPGRAPPSRRRSRAV